MPRVILRSSAAQPEFGRGIEGRARPQDHGGKSRLVGGIGKMLGLQAEAMTVVVPMAIFGRKGTVEKVPRVKLNARLGRAHLEASPGTGM